MTEKEKIFVSAVIYVHNAEERIVPFLNTVLHVLEEHFEQSEVICVNDASEDGSAAIIRKIAQEGNRKASVSLLNLSFFHGLETAMNAGVELSIGDFVFEFDETFPEFGPEEILRIYGRAQEGFDIVSASPIGESDFSSRIFYRIFQKFTDVPSELRTESFRVLSRRVINRIGSANRIVLYRKVAYAACGLKTDCLSYAPLFRRKIADRAERKYRTGLAVDTIIMFTDLGWRFSLAMTAVMMFFAAAMLGYTVAVYLMSSPVPGWTTTLLFLSTAFFGLFGILTVVIKYLQLLLDLAVRRRRCSFESIEKLS